MSKLTYRLLATRFVEMVAAPNAGIALTDLAAATVQAAREAGLSDVSRLTAAIEQELLARHGVADIQVTTARSLTSDELATLGDQVAKVIGATQHGVEGHVDTDMIGGFEAVAAGQAIRGSIASQLSSLTTVGVQHG